MVLQGRQKLILSKLLAVECKYVLDILNEAIILLLE